MEWHTLVGGSQAGPMSLEDVRAAVETGNLRADDLVWNEGLEDWQRVASIPELGVPQAGVSLGAPPVVPAQAEGFDPIKLVVPVSTTGLSIAAGYLGLFSLIGCAAPIAVVVGILALRDLKRRPHLDGKGRAWFGIVMGALCTCGYGLLIGFNAWAAANRP